MPLIWIKTETKQQQKKTEQNPKKRMNKNDKSNSYSARDFR